MPAVHAPSQNVIRARQSQAGLQDNPELRRLLEQLLDGRVATPQTVAEVERLAGKLSVVERAAIRDTFGAIDVLYNVDPKMRAALDRFIRREDEAREAYIHAITPMHRRAADLAHAGLVAVGLASIVGIWAGIVGGGGDPNVAAGFMSPGFAALLGTAAAGYVVERVEDSVRPNETEIAKRSAEYGRRD